MQTVSKQFAGTGRSGGMLLTFGQSLAYRVDLSSDWDGTVVLRKSADGGLTWTLVHAVSADVSGTVVTSTSRDGEVYEFACSVFTAGTADVYLFKLDATGVARDVAGTTSIATVSATEEQFGFVRRTTLRLASVPVSVVSVTSGNGVGGTKIYDFPEGRQLLMGTLADLALHIKPAQEADFTDATPEGDVGIGTAAPADADALGADATDDDLATAAAFTMADYAATVQCPNEAIQTLNGASTPVDMYVTMLVDAADIDDDTTSTVYVSGLVVFYWINLGDF